MSASEASGSEVVLADYESNPSLDIVVDMKKLREDLAREEEEERLKASEEKENDANGEAKTPITTMQRIEREIKKRRTQFKKDMHKQLHKPYDRKAYKATLDKKDLEDMAGTTVRVSANEDQLTISIFQRLPDSE